jgi:hypothetical protein
MNQLSSPGNVAVTLCRDEPSRSRFAQQFINHWEISARTVEKCDVADRQAPLCKAHHAERDGYVEGSSRGMRGVDTFGVRHAKHFRTNGLIAV